jgi:hypothetical protein
MINRMEEFINKRPVFMAIVSGLMIIALFGVLIVVIIAFQPSKWSSGPAPDGFHYAEESSGQIAETAARASLVKAWTIKPIYKIIVSGCGLDDRPVTVDVVRIDGKTYHLFWSHDTLVSVQPETTNVGIAEDASKEPTH